MRCPSCPVRPDRPCLGETPRFASFCALAEGGDPVKRAHVVNRSAIAEGGPSGEPTGTFPPLLTQARNLAGAVVRFVASGGELASDEEKARRLAICEACDQFSHGRCRRCGCLLMAKVAAATEHCPLDPPKWGVSVQRT